MNRDGWAANIHRDARRTIQYSYGISTDPELNPGKVGLSKKSLKSLHQIKFVSANCLPAQPENNSRQRSNQPDILDLVDLKQVNYRLSRAPRRRAIASPENTISMTTSENAAPSGQL